MWAFWPKYAKLTSIVIAIKGECYMWHRYNLVIMLQNMKTSIDQSHVGHWKTIIMDSSCDDHSIWKIVA